MCMHWRIFLINVTAYLLISAWHPEKDGGCSHKLWVSIQFSFKGHTGLQKDLGRHQEMLSLATFTKQKYPNPFHLQLYMVQIVLNEPPTRNKELDTKFHFSLGYRHEELQLLLFPKTPKPGFTGGSWTRINPASYLFVDSHNTMNCCTCSATNNR